MPTRRHLLQLPLPLLAGLAAVSRPAPAREARGDGAWARLDAVARAAVEAREVPGLVLLVGQGRKVLYRRAFGSRSVRPQAEPMTTDTVFDLASLTKVVATASCVMALVEEGRLRLNDPAARYWPEFGKNGKERVTLRQLLTHTSGLVAWEDYWKRLAAPAGPAVQDRRDAVLEAITEAALRQPPDTRFVYSDLGFITLGEVVHRVTGESLDAYARRRIFAPLRMNETGFSPPEPLRRRAAPTTERGGGFLRGEVHDGNAAVSGGVAGHAGLFSTADDLARFARMLLSSDDADRHSYPLRPYTIRRMTTPSSPPGLPVRGLGWDIDSPYSSVRGDLFPIGSFGHTGFTGTCIWVDPYSGAYLIGLSNRVHPDGQGSHIGLWARASNVVAGIVRGQAPPPRGPVPAAPPPP